jgi:hypothetical protein
MKEEGRKETLNVFPERNDLDFLWATWIKSSFPMLSLFEPGETKLVQVATPSNYQGVKHLAPPSHLSYSVVALNITGHASVFPFRCISQQPSHLIWSSFF